jgi:hypothetical protein
MNKLLKLFLFSLALSFTQASFGAAHAKKAMDGMTLDNALSTLSFVSIKNGAVGEVHTIDKLSGSLSDAGDLMVTLDLSSVNTKIDIRNERMQKYLFETGKNPTATVSAKIGKVADGVSRVKGAVELNLHGVKKNIDFEAITVMSDGKLVVSSIKPIIIKASDYGMEGGVAMLQKLAKLPSIATAVPVSFVLTFSK